MSNDQLAERTRGVRYSRLTLLSVFTVGFSRCDPTLVDQDWIAFNFGCGKFLAVFLAGPFRPAYRRYKFRSMAGEDRKTSWSDPFHYTACMSTGLQYNNFVQINKVIFLYMHKKLG